MSPVGKTNIGHGPDVFKVKRERNRDWFWFSNAGNGVSMWIVSPDPLDARDQFVMVLDNELLKIRRRLSDDSLQFYIHASLLEL